MTMSFAENLSFDSSRGADRGAPRRRELEDLCTEYNEAWVEALYAGVVSEPGPDRDEEIGIVFDQVEPALKTLELALQTGDDVTPQVVQTAERLRRLVERLANEREVPNADRNLMN